MRWVASIVLLLVLLLIVGGAIALVPAHLQIRNVAPALPADADLRALARVPGGPVAIHYVESSRQESPDRTLGHSIVLIEWADGRAFMIDAAMDREATQDFAELISWMVPNAGPAEFHGTAAELLGKRVERVEGVGFTHLHQDHVQGIEAFCARRGPGAKVYQTSWQAREHNLHTRESARTVADSCLESVTLEGEGLLTSADFPGLGIAGLGGHTPGSTLYAVWVGGKLWLMSGDISNVKANLLSNTDKGFVYSNLIVPEATARTETLRVWLAALDAKDDIEVVVAHDVEAAAASGLPEFRAAGNWNVTLPNALSAR